MFTLSLHIQNHLKIFRIIFHVHSKLWTGCIVASKTMIVLETQNCTLATKFGLLWLWNDFRKWLEIVRGMNSPAEMTRQPPVPTYFSADFLWFCFCQKYFAQIFFQIWTNTFWNLDKYILKFGQIHFTIWTNTPVIDERPKGPIEKRKRNDKFFSPVSREERETRNSFRQFWEEKEKPMRTRPE